MLSDQWIFFTHNSPMLLQELQTQFRFSQPPADTETVARPRSRPQDGVTRTHLARDCHINEDFLPPRGVPTRQHTLELSGRAPQSAQEPIQPRPGVRFGQRQAQEKTSRHSPHCCNIADRSREALPAYRVRGMHIPQEMRPLQEPVTRQNYFVSRFRFEKCGFVADSSRENPELLLCQRTGRLRNLLQKGILIGILR